MLVLTRRSSQSIVIGKDIVVTVLEVRGDQVRIGVSAPRDVDVHREEVFLELQEANRSAASPSAAAVEALGQLLPGDGAAQPAQPDARPSERRPGGLVRTDRARELVRSVHPDRRAHSAPVTLDHLGAGPLLPKPSCRDDTGSAQHRGAARVRVRSGHYRSTSTSWSPTACPWCVPSSAAWPRHYPRHCDRDELVAAGTFGLVEAARRFDPSKGVPFERWAVLRIRGAVVDAVRALDFAPRALRSSARDLTAVRETLERELGRTPTSEQVAERMGMPLADLVQLEGRLHRSTVLSLDAPTRDHEGDTTLAAIVLDPGADPLEELERRERDSYVHRRPAVAARAAVGGARRLLPRGTHLRPSSPSELGVTESRISQMRTEALTLVREGLAAQYGERTTVQTGSRRGQAGRLQRLAVGPLELRRAAVAARPAPLAAGPRRRLTPPLNPPAPSRPMGA